MNHRIFWVMLSWLFLVVVPVRAAGIEALNVQVTGMA